MIIRKLTDSDKSELKEVVDIHMSTFTGFFLTFMGRGFLYQMYSSYIDHPDSDILIAADKDNNLLGFLAYSKSLSDLYKFMIKSRLIPFAWYSLGAFLRKPVVFMRLIRAFLKPGETAKKEAYVELSSIGVRPDAKSRGVGSRLIDALKQKVDFDSYAYITLETDAVDNDPANHFYRKNGFELVREFETREHRKMNEYRYSA